MGGLAAVVGGVLLAVSDLLSFLTEDPEEEFSEVAITGFFAFVQVLYLLGIVLVLCGLVGLYARQIEATGILGLAGFVVALVGTVLVAGLFWASLFVVPSLAIAAPEFLDAEEVAGPLELGFMLTFAVFGLGWLLFGVASLRARVYPRVAAIVLMIGAVLSILPVPLTGLVISVAVAWLGFVLFTGRGEAAQQPSRVS